MDPLIGTRLGQYLVVEKIGEGGMGAVYRAEHSRLGIVRAVKVLPDRLVSDRPEYLERFWREARAAVAIDHPNVVRVFDAAEDRGVFYMIMELVEGESLDRVLARRGALPELEALGLAAQAAEGLSAALAVGFVHRDVKPSNLMVTPGGQLKVADFGLAKDTEAEAAVTVAGELIGTPYYMSPEQAEGLPADLRSDVYALGITLYEMLTGIQPFRADSIPALLRMHCERLAPDPGDIRPGLDPGARALVARMTAKDPSDRFQSYEALLEATREIAGRLGARAGSMIDSIAVPGRGEGTGQGRRAAPAQERSKPRGARRPTSGSSARKRSKKRVKVRPIRGGPPPAASAEQGGADKAIRLIEEGLTRVSVARGPDAMSSAGWQVIQVAAGGLDSRGNPVLARAAPKAGPGNGWPAEIWLSSKDDRGGVLLFDFVLVPPGKFRMGSAGSEPGRNSDEGPPHEVTFGYGFYLGKYEVMRRQWAALMGSDPSYSDQLDPGLPVEQVSWRDVRDFAARMNERQWLPGPPGGPSAGKFRLPSEAEWEYACRAGTRWRHGSGDSLEDLARAAWFEANSSSCLHPVGLKEPNAWGLYDMLGNLWEWCEDVWHDGYASAPRDGSPWLLGGDQSLRVLRGGSCDYEGPACRCANRYRAPAGARRANCGARLVWAPASPAQGAWRSE